MIMVVDQDGEESPAAPPTAVDTDIDSAIRDYVMSDTDLTDK